MAVSAPNWLTQRSGSLTLSSDGHTWFFMLGKEAMYRLAVRPAEGQFSCQITQTINGRPIESKGIFPTPDEAVRGGLEDLRKALGW